MKILVINAGSSSLKYQLIDMDNEQVMAKGLCERIGIEGSNLQHTNVAKDEDTTHKGRAYCVAAAFCSTHRKKPSMPVRVGTERQPCSPAVIPAGSGTSGAQTSNSG